MDDVDCPSLDDAWSSNFVGDGSSLAGDWWPVAGDGSGEENSVIPEAGSSTSWIDRFIEILPESILRKSFDSLVGSRYSA